MYERECKKYLYDSNNVNKYRLHYKMFAAQENVNLILIFIMGEIGELDFQTEIVQHDMGKNSHKTTT